MEEFISSMRSYAASAGNSVAEMAKDGMRYVENAAGKNAATTIGIGTAICVGGALVVSLPAWAVAGGVAMGAGAGVALYGMARQQGSRGFLASNDNPVENKPVNIASTEHSKSRPTPSQSAELTPGELTPTQVASTPPPTNDRGNGRA